MAKIDAETIDKRWRQYSVRSWSEIEADWAAKMVNDAVGRSKADSDGLGALPMQSGSEKILTP